MQKSSRVEGYSIYHPEQDEHGNYYRFDFDKTIGAAIETVTTMHNENRVELRTFGTKPYVYYAGSTDYQSFPLHGIFVTEYDADGETTKTALEIYNEFKRVLRMRVPLMIENSIGEVLICDVSLDQRVAPLQYAEQNMEFIEVNVSCVEVDKIGR